MYKLTHLDNQQSAGQSVVGKTAPFTFDGKTFIFSTIKSSTVKSINTFDNGDMTVKTRNSTYTFKKQ